MRRYLRRNKDIKAIAFFFLIMGIAFLISSIFSYIYVHNFIKNGEEINATIISITTIGSGEDERYFVEVEYFVNDVKYINSLGYYDSEMMEGQTIPIIYLPNNPNKIIYGESVILTYKCA